MKIFLAIIFYFFTVNAFSQTKKTNENSIPDKSPAIFLDSVRIDGHQFFDNSKIENIKVIKEDAAFPNGRIYMKSKSSANFKFLSAKDILKAYNIPQGTSAIFMLDNEIIMDSKSFKIDSSYIMNVEIVKTSEIEYLPNNIPSMAILKIFTSAKDNIDSQNIIRIRRRSVALNN